MPVDKNQRWESWATRLAREAAEKAAQDALDASLPDDNGLLKPEKPTQTRRNRTAAEAAIAQATGTSVTIEEPE